MQLKNVHDVINFIIALEEGVKKPILFTDMSVNGGGDFKLKREKVVVLTRFNPSPCFARKLSVFIHL